MSKAGNPPKGAGQSTSRSLSKRASKGSPSGDSIAISRRGGRSRRESLESRLPAIAFAISAHLILLTMSFVVWPPPKLLLPESPQVMMFLPIDLAPIDSTVDTPPESPESPELVETTEPELSPQPLAEVSLPELPSVPTPATPISEIAPPTNVMDALAGMTASAAVFAHKAVSDGRTPGAYGGRSGSLKASLLAKHGGSQHTEAALHSGLAWLASVQELSPETRAAGHGRWDSDGFMASYLPKQVGENDQDWRERVKGEGPGYSQNDLGLTALVLLAFTGAGHTPSSGPFAVNVDAAIRYILRTQNADGAFMSPGRGPTGNVYDHAISLQALADALALTGDQNLVQPVSKGMEFLVKIQQPLGGWDYKCYPTPNEPPRNDLSLSGFAIMALSACRQCGFKPPNSAFERAIGMLKRHTDRDGSGIYADAIPGQNRTGPAMTAVNLFSRRLLGEPLDSPTQQKQATMIARRLPNWRTSVEMGDDPYMWYYGALALMHEDDSRWHSFNVSLKSTLTGTQEREEGPRKGSWAPTTHYGKAGGGRVYATAMACLCLEVYYRYVPEHLRSGNADLAVQWR